MSNTYEHRGDSSPVPNPGPADLSVFLRRGVIPTKFMHVGSGARIQAQLPSVTPGYYDDGRLEPEVRMVSSSLRRTGATQILDLGVNNGYHSAEVLRGLLADACRIASYIGVEISRELVLEAQQRVGDAFPYDAQLLALDLESASDLSQLDLVRNEGRVTLLLGGTIGNAEDPHQVLTGLRGISRSGDGLVVGIYCPSVSGNRDADFYMQPLVAANTIAPLIDCGVPADAIDFSAKSSSLGDIVGIATITRDIGDMELKKGDSFRLFLSRRFTLAQASKALLSAGWMPLDSCQVGDYAIVSCAPV